MLSAMKLLAVALALSFATPAFACPNMDKDEAPTPRTADKADKKAPAKPATTEKAKPATTEKAPADAKAKPADAKKPAEKVG
jgi:hypothetical protein